MSKPLNQLLNRLLNSLSLTPAAAQWLGLTLALCILAGGIGYRVIRDHEATGERERSRLAAQARILTENLEYQLSSTSRALESIRSDPAFWTGGGGAQATSRLEALQRAMPAMRSLTILDARGTVVASSRTELVGQNFAGRSYFQAVRERPDAQTLYISPPFKTALGVFAITVTRMIPGHDGKFAGVIAATLDPDYFRTLMKSVLYAPDGWDAISHGDGRLFLIEPAQQASPGSDLTAPESFFSRHRASGRSDSIFTGRAYLTGDQRIAALRTLQPASLQMDKPLIVTVNRNLDAVFSVWRGETVFDLGFLALFSLASVLGLYGHQRRQRRADERQAASAMALARSAERLELASQASGIGVWDYDFTTGHLLWDKAMFALYGVAETAAPQCYEDWQSAVLPEDRAEAERLVQAAVDAGTPYRHRFRIRRGDGAVRDIEARAKVFCDAQGRALRLVGTNEDITERSRIETALRDSRAELVEAQRISHVGNWKADWTIRNVVWSEELYRMLGLDPALPPPDYTEHHRLFSADSWTHLRQHLVRARDDGAPFELELETRRGDGGHGWMLCRGEAIRDPGGAIVGLHGVAMDITERKHAEAKNQLAASVFTNAREGIMITDTHGAIIEVNAAFSRITGYSREEAIGQNPRFLKSGREDRDFYAGLWHALSQQGYWSGEIWNRRKNGEVYVEMLTISAVRDGQGKVHQYVGLFSDISTLKEHERQLEYIAHFDALTGLPNRGLLADRLHQAMAQVQRRGQTLAVAFLDLDGFKAINDSYGHEAGDQLLMAVAARMKLGLREGDTLARLGGDEFVAVLIDLSEVADGIPLVARLIAEAAEPVVVNGHQLQVSASVGITYYPQPEEVDADQLLRQADLAMYQAKLAGKNRYYIFDTEQDRSLRGHHESIKSIERALAGGEFLLHYQPKVNMRSGEVLGVEALIRWQHPERGLLSPALFLPVIEDHPLAVAVGEWVIGRALAQIDTWQAAGIGVRVSVNIGARHLRQTDFVERLASLLGGHPGIRPEQLELEVLETSALGDLAQVSRIIDDCRTLGVGFALDDFGTGYSSLTYLKRLSASMIKIDQSFVRDMLDDPEDLAILEGVLGLASAFRRQVIAEGVETVAHGEMLLRLGCELGQGYGIARPMPADEFPAWAAAWQPDPRWQDCAPVNRWDLPLLYAGVEHRAWILAFEAALKKERDVPPPLDPRHCRFGEWLNGELQAGRSAQSAFRAIDALHRQVHVLSTELYQLQAVGEEAVALARLGELHVLRDALLGQLDVVTLGS